jgi:carboxyl-terminal processing protease
VVVGSATLGKGLVQTIAPLPDGGELFITWSRVITPAGYPLQGLGVLPQICTSQGQGLIDRQMAALAHGELLTGPTLQRHDNARAPVPLSQILDIRATCPAAEGRDADLVVARKLLSDPAQYAAARLSIALPAP